MPDRLYAGALEEDTGIVRLPWHSRTFHQLYNIQFLLNTTLFWSRMHILVFSWRVEPNSLPYCTWRVSSRKLKPCGNCFYNSVSVLGTLWMSRIFSMFMPSLWLKKTDQKSLEQKCAGLVLGDPWNTGVCKSETWHANLWVVVANKIK